MKSEYEGHSPPKLFPEARGKLENKANLASLCNLACFTHCLGTCMQDYSPGGYNLGNTTEILSL